MFLESPASCKKQTQKHGPPQFEDVWNDSVSCIFLVTQTCIFMMQMNMSHIPYVINASFSPPYSDGFPLANPSRRTSRFIRRFPSQSSNPIPTGSHPQPNRIWKCIGACHFFLQVILPIGNENLKRYFITLGRHVVWANIAQRKIPRPYSVVIFPDMFWRKDLRLHPKSK